jgi:hypothetical protein
MQIKYPVDLGILGECLITIHFQYHPADDTVGVKDDIEVTDITDESGLLTKAAETSLFYQLRYNKYVDRECREALKERSQLDNIEWLS